MKKVLSICAVALMLCMTTIPAFAADLTDRERDIAGLIAEGLDNREIAGALYLSEGTVRNHISAILQKCALKNRTQIAIAWWR